MATAVPMAVSVVSQSEFYSTIELYQTFNSDPALPDPALPVLQCPVWRQCTAKEQGVVCANQVATRLTGARAATHHHTHAGPVHHTVLFNSKYMRASHMHMPRLLQAWVTRAQILAAGQCLCTPPPGQWVVQHAAFGGARAGPRPGQAHAPPHTRTTTYRLRRAAATTASMAVTEAATCKLAASQYGGSSLG